MELSIHTMESKISITLFTCMLILAGLLGIYYNFTYKHTITALDNEINNSRTSITRYLKESINNQNALVTSFYDKKNFKRKQIRSYTLWSPQQGLPINTIISTGSYDPVDFIMFMPYYYCLLLS